MSEMKKFTFDAFNNVKAMYEVKGARTKLESTRGTTFETEMGTYDNGLNGVVEITATKLGRGKTEISVYADQDGDGRFLEAFEIDVMNSSGYRVENYKFDLSGDTVVAAWELERRGWKVDRMDDNEDYSLVTVGEETFVLKTESEWNSTEFDIFVDRDNDGLWTKIADGESKGAYLTIDGQVDLVGLVNDGLLAPADVVIV